MFVDMIFFFLASDFMPKDNYTSVDKDSVINNVVEYFRNVRYNRYILFDNKSINKSLLEANYDDVSTRREKTQKREHKVNPYVAEDNIKRMRLTGRKKIL